MRLLSRRHAAAGLAAGLGAGLGTGLSPWRAVAAVQGAATDAPPSPSSPPGGIVAGALLPLSGGMSLVGDECLRGVQLAVDAANAAGGVAGTPVALITADDTAGGQAQAAARGLIGRHAQLLLGSGASELSYPASAAAELAQVPYIELNAPADGIMQRGFKFLIRTGLTTQAIAGVATAAIAKLYPGQKIGLLFNAGATCGAVAAAALELWAKAKVQPLLSIAYAPDVGDLHEPVARLKRAGVQVVLHAADPDDALLFYAALNDFSFAPAGIVGCGDGYGLRETAYALGGAMDGTHAVTAPDYPPAAAGVAAAYLARYGMPPRGPDSLTAYVGARLAFDRLAAVGGDPKRLLDALHGADLPPGGLVNGWGVKFDGAGQNTRAFAVLQQWQGVAMTQVAI